MWRWTPLALTFAALLGCTGPVVQRDGYGRRLCQAADLDARWGGVNGATGGEMLGYVAVADRSPEPCAVLGIPQITILMAPPPGIPSTLELTLPDTGERFSVPLGSNADAQYERHFVALATCATGLTVFGYAPG